MDDSSGVGGFQRRSQFFGMSERLRDGRRPAAQILRERLAGNMLHDDKIRPGMGHDLMDDHYIGVPEAGRRAGFPQELETAVRVGRAMQRFDRDLTVQAGVQRLVNRPHPAFPDLLENPVLFYFLANCQNSLHR